jgi:hypothetical protein
VEAEVINCDVNGAVKAVRCSATNSESTCKASANECESLPRSESEHSALAITIPNAVSCGDMNAYLCR